MTQQWSAEEVLETAWGFKTVCVLTAGAELGLFDALSEGPATADELAGRLETDPRATTMLADAMASMSLLTKEAGRYDLAGGIADLLTESGRGSVLAMVRHLANCLRSWSQLAEVVRTGRRAERTASVLGAEADMGSFIEAMHEISRPIAEKLIAAIGPPAFEHLLDLGGGPGTWTIAFLRAAPSAKATLFDLPAAMPIAQRHVAEAGLEDRVTLVAGDFEQDPPLPVGADLAWVSAIVHMNSRQENRDLFAKVRAALADGGRVLIRDVLMDASRTGPAEGAMFAVNMLVNTPGGTSYTFEELRDDLLASGFAEPRLLRRGEFMDSVIEAAK